MADLYEIRARERRRLEQMESEANKSRDCRGRRSPVDLMLLAGQRNMLGLIETAITRGQQGE